MPNLVGIGNSQVPTNAMLGGLAYQDPAHAVLTNVEPGDIAAIKAKTADTAVDVFVYDTRKDSDGGAWRKRTSHTSWYSEGASDTRGARKEFPAVAVIVVESNATTIYDADDPNLSMWMKFITTTGGDKIFNRPQYWNSSSVFALNGIVCIANLAGSAESTCVLNYVSDSVRLYPIDGYPTYGGDYNLGIGERSGSTGAFKTISQTIYGDEAFDVAMTVLPNAPIDPVTGLPIPTIAVATGHGFSVIGDDGLVWDRVATTGGYVVSREVEIHGNMLYLLQDPYLLYTYSLPLSKNDTQGTLGGYNGLAFTTTLQAAPGNAASTSHISIYGSDKSKKNFALGTATGLILDVPNYEASNYLDAATGRLYASIGDDYNTGWMCGDAKSAWLADTDDTDITGSELVTNGDFGSAIGSTWVVRENGGTFVTNGSNQGVLTYVSAVTSWEQDITIVSGKTYTLSFDIISTTTTSIQFYYNAGGGDVAVSNAGTAGKHGATFVASSNSVKLFPRIFASGNVVWDNITLRESVDDRARHIEGLQIYGTVAVEPVATGAELVGYGPFSTSNRLRAPYRGTSTYPSLTHFETGDFNVTFWMNHDGTDAHQSLVGRDNREFAVDVLNNSSYNRRFRIYAFNSSNSLQTFDSNDDPFILNTWTHVCVNYTNGNTASIYINGELNKTGALDYDIDDTTNGINIGCRNTSGSYAYPANGTKLSLVRITGAAPTPEQIKKMYDDESKLFAENAKCTLYGSSDAVTAVAYDDSNDTVHVGTSAGRSDFVGLNRINNTTTAVTTAISASNGVIAEQ